MDTRGSGEEDSSGTSTKSLNHNQKKTSRSPVLGLSARRVSLWCLPSPVAFRKLSCARWKDCCTHPESRGVGGVRCCSVLCTNGTISHVLPASIPALMNQAPLIADFTLSGPIVGLYRRGFDSSGQTLREGGGEEGVGSISGKKTCQQNKILTNDRKDREIPPPFPSQAPGQSSILGRQRHHLDRLVFYNVEEALLRWRARCLHKRIEPVT